MCHDITAVATLWSNTSQHGTTTWKEFENHLPCQSDSQLFLLLGALEQLTIVARLGKQQCVLTTACYALDAQNRLVEPNHRSLGPLPLVLALMCVQVFI